jgi:hypothetical protein
VDDEVAANYTERADRPQAVNAGCGRRAPTLLLHKLSTDPPGGWGRTTSGFHPTRVGRRRGLAMAPGTKARKPIANPPLVMPQSCELWTRHGPSHCTASHASLTAVKSVLGTAAPLDWNVPILTWSPALNRRSVLPSCV